MWEHDKMNVLAFWTFEDCWKYIAREKIPYHPMHDDGEIPYLNPNPEPQTPDPKL